MNRGLVRDAATMATVAKVNEILRECEKILAEHSKRASQGIYGSGIWAAALEHDLTSAHARLNRVRTLVAGGTENKAAQ